MRPSGLGSLIGGGMGRRYSYIDLAICHLDHGVAEVRRALCEAGAPERSWILFFDTQLAQEWLGVYDTTPSPPVGEIDEDDEPRESN